MTKSEFLEKLNAFLHKQYMWNQHKKGPPSVIAKELVFTLMEISKLVKKYENE